MRILLPLLLTGAMSAAADLPLTAVAEASFRVSDMEKARSFYTGVMGYQEAFHVPGDEGAELYYFKVNDEQYIAITPTLKKGQDVRLRHYGLLTTNVKLLRRMLEERGLAPSAVAKGADGTLWFAIKDPDGQEMRFIEYLPDSMQARSKGKFLDDRRISKRILHTGLGVADLEPSLALYRDKLGLVETWRGGKEPGMVSWVALKIPASSGDYVEFLTHKEPMTRGLYGSFHHLGLEVPEINNAYRTTYERLAITPDPRTAPALGKSQSWIAQAHDPDGTRMEWEQRPKCSDVGDRPYALRPCLAAILVPYSELVGLFDYDRAAPLDVTEASVTEREGITVHDISYSSPKGGRVPAYLLTPPGKGPFPAILFQHGGKGNRTQLLPGALAMAKAGAVCLLINGATNRDRTPPGNNPLAPPSQLRAELIQNVIDLRRGIDLLSARPEVARDRIAYAGWSMGAMVGGVLSGVDHRVKAFVLVSGAGTWADLVAASGNPAVVEARKLLGAEELHKRMSVLDDLDPVQYIGHAAPSALRFENGRQDRAVPEDGARRLQEAASDPKDIAWYDATHELFVFPEAARDRAAWLARQLSLP